MWEIHSTSAHVTTTTIQKSHRNCTNLTIPHGSRPSTPHPHKLTHSPNTNKSLPPKKQTPKPHNLPINHIALAVDSLDEASAWYATHFGFRRIRSDRTSDRISDDPKSPIFRIYGDKLKKVRVAWLVAGNGVGFEIFEFVDPPVKGAEEIKAGWTLEEQVSFTL